MIDNILSDWNSTFASHKCRLFAKSVVLHEFAKDAKFTDLTIKLAKAISLPSRQYDGFNHWGCFGNKNCDGVYLVEVGDKYDLVAVELKSAFSTEELYDAKEQIDVSLQKTKVLLKTLSSFSDTDIRFSYGIIVSLAPDDNTLDWIKQMVNLPRKDWKKDTVGLSLFVDRSYMVRKKVSHICDSVCPKQYDIYYYMSDKPSKTITLPVR